MALVSSDYFVLLVDKLVRAYVYALSASGQTYGIGENGDTDRAAGEFTDAASLVAGSADTSLQAALSTPCLLSQAACSSKYLIGVPTKKLIYGLSGYLRGQASASYSDLDSFLTYLNQNSPYWVCPVDYRWYTLYNASFGSGSTRYPAQGNLYFEVLQGSTYSNALAKFIVSGAGAGATTLGASISSSLYAGGTPCVKVSSLTGSGVVTVTGTAYDPATGTVSTGKTWTATISSGGGGRFYLSPGTAAASSYILAVSSITIASGITAGTFYIEAERATWRTSTAVAGASTTITLDASASAITDAYVGCSIGHSGDKYTWRTCSAYNGSTKVATVSSSWSSNPTGSDTFRVLRPQFP